MQNTIYDFEVDMVNILGSEIKLKGVNHRLKLGN